MRSINNIFKLATKDIGKDKDGKDTSEETDVVTRCTGGWGPWHICICLAIFLVKVPVAWHQLVHIFEAPPMAYKCELNDTKSCSPDCPGVVYDTNIFQKTTITEWNLICDRAWMADLSQTCVMIGILVGNVLFGFLADRFGRRTPLILAVLVQILSGTAAAFSPWYGLYVFLRFVSAVATGGTMVTSFVMVMEVVGQDYRTSLGLLYQIPFNLGHLSLVGVAYLLRNWYHLQLAISLPSILLLTYQLFLPESPRWLLALNRSEECIKIMENIARHNNLPTDGIRANVEKHLEEKKTQAASAGEQKKGGNWLDLVRTRIMLVRTVCISYNWAVCGLCFFGVAQYMGQIPGDIFVNVAVSAVVGIPGMFVLLYSLPTWGRRVTLILSNVITGVACLLIVAVPKTAQWEWAGTLLGCLGMVGMSMAFPTVYMYSGEMYPTTVRNLGVGFCSMICRIGSMLAPFVVRLNALQPALPPLVFGTFPLAGAALCYFLPETRNCPLPDTVEEAERLGKVDKKQENSKL